MKNMKVNKKICPDSVIVMKSEDSQLVYKRI
jgi:hypothetical protein